MKSHVVQLDAIQVRNLFSPIRTKRDIIEVLMRTIKILILQSPSEVEDSRGEIHLIISKMSRLFYFTENKYFSIGLPFSVQISGDGTLKFYSTHLPNIDSKVTSNVLGLIADENYLHVNDIYEFFEPIAELENDEENIWPFILQLFMYDDGYIRYDFDDKNVDGRVHPLNHYDIFHSSASTFKMGLKGRLEPEQIVDLLNLKTDCHFLE